MLPALRDITCACIPSAALGALAELRRHPGLVVALEDSRTWLRWEAGDEDVLRCVLPLEGVQLYTWREGRWYRQGMHLPAFDFPKQLDFRPLHRQLTPEPVLPLAAPDVKMQPAVLALAEDQRPRRTTALLCVLSEFAAWADTVPEARLRKLRAVYCKRRLLVVGERLPLLKNGARFWGERLLVPLGRTPHPDWPEAWLLTALGINEDELALLGPDGVERVPRLLFIPIQRARLQQTLQESPP